MSADRPLAVSFGGGVNSVAMLVGLAERELRPDLILFADTKSEFPETYDLVARASHWCVERGWPAIDIVAKTFKGAHEGLEIECLRKLMLPGLAYGTRSCSIKHKGQPMDRRLRKWAKDNVVGLPVTKAIGYDAGEGHRLQKVSPEPGLWTAWYPLGEWGWDRARCVEVARSAGFRCVVKSACFFCPATKRGEIIRMAETHPDLMDRALRLEAAAVTANDRGLGGTFKWADVLQGDRDQLRFDMEENPFLPCGCVE